MCQCPLEHDLQGSVLSWCKTIDIIWMVFDKFNPVSHKNLEPLSFISDVCKDNFTISPKYFLIGIWNSFFNSTDILTESIAATNSILGIVIHFQKQHVPCQWLDHNEFCPCCQQVVGMKLAHNHILMHLKSHAVCFQQLCQS